MKSVKISVIILVVVIAGGVILYLAKNKTPQTENSEKITSNQPKNMEISSPDFGNGENMPARFTCDGENMSPELRFSDIPEGAKSLALIMHDPDAPAPGGFTHWITFDMDPAASGIPENTKISSGTEGTNSGNGIGYTSPCPPRLAQGEAGPPSRTHHYHFKLYALDMTLDLGSSARREDVEQAMKGHILDQAEIIGLYARQ